MKTRIRATAVLCLPAVVACCTLPSASAGAASTVSPLPASNYTVRPVCAAPAPGHAGCLAMQLVAKAPLSVRGAHALFKAGRNASGSSSPAIEFKEPFEGSLTPSNLRTAYNLLGTPPPASTQTIALVNAYDDPKAESDLASYDKEFSLPPCTEVSGCFRKVNQAGNKSPLPPSNTEGREPEAGWALEISTDIEVAHGICESCHILLVEANSAEFSELEIAEETAVRLGASEISNSWGGPEAGEDSKAFNHAGIVITAAAGDSGYLDWGAEKEEERGLPDYPASSPHVVAVGGTRLLQSHGVREGETVWNDGGQNTKGEIEGAGAGGGGCSTSFLAPSWQLSVPDWEFVGCGADRAVADVSADADPYTGVAVYDSTPVTEEGEEIKGWNVLGGTSVASPIIAAVFGLAGGAHGVEYPAETMYENLAASPSSLHDVELGSNGKCSKPFDTVNGLSGCTPAEEAASSGCSAPELICLAGKGYDGPSGVGTPNGIAAFQPLTEEAKKTIEEQKRKEKLEEEKSKSKNEGPAGGEGSKEPGKPASQPSTTVSGGAPTTGGATSLGSPDLVPIVPVLSALTLTRNATAALSRAAPRPKVSRVAFAFTLNVAARVHVTLAKLLVTHGRHRWQTLPYSLTIGGARGRNRRRLASLHTLTPGRYRLTLAPVHGTARRLTFKVG